MLRTNNIGGKAVFRARNLIWILDETLTFNDETTYHAIGIYKEASSQADLKKDPSFTLHPNPADEAVNIVFGEPHSGASEITIKDITGRIVFSQALYNPAKTLELTTSRFDQGVYLVEWKYAGHKPQTEKLTIIR